MHDDEPIDLTALTSPDPARFERRVARTMARALATRPRPTLWGELTGLTWPLVTAAAVVSVAAAVLLVAMPTRTSASLSADVVAEWANQGDIPGSVDVVALAGETP
jgi:hypothetical protein